MPDRHATVDSIADVLDALDDVIASALERGSRIGYFAVIYRKMTAKIAEGIAGGFFDDGERMERLDVHFARRYLDAVDARDGQPTRSWQVAARAAANPRPIILQHLLLGINAHINLDLGIAAATTSPGQDVFDLRGDFDRVNEVIAALIAQVEQLLAEVSPWIGLIDHIGGRHDEEVIRFSIEVARAQAWRFALELAPIAPEHWAGPIRSRDFRVAHVAAAVLTPGLLTAGLLVIRARESNDVRHNIEVLGRVTPPSMNAIEMRVRQPRAPSP